MQGKDEALELVWNANAYLDCAKRLCSSLLEEGHEKSIHHNRVPLHLTFLAIELYYKAGISAFGSSDPPIHDLVELRKLYEKAVPDIPLPLPSFIQSLIPKTADLFPEYPDLSLSEHFIRYRYYADRKRRPFPKLEMVDVKALHSQLETLHHEAFPIMARIWQLAGHY